MFRVAGAICERRRLLSLFIAPLASFPVLLAIQRKTLLSGDRGYRVADGAFCGFRLACSIDGVLPLWLARSAMEDWQCLGTALSFQRERTAQPEFSCPQRPAIGVTARWR